MWLLPEWWSTCRLDEQACYRPLQPKEAPISIIGRSLTQADEDAFGCLVRRSEGSYRIVVFYERIEFAGRKAVSDPAILLGMTMIHETGRFFGLNHTLWLKPLRRHIRRRPQRVR